VLEKIRCDKGLEALVYASPFIFKAPRWSCSRTPKSMYPRNCTPSVLKSASVFSTVGRSTPMRKAI